MENEYLNFIIFLENTLASYYQKIKNLPRLEGARNVLEFMEVHSKEHAEVIEQSKNKHKKPVIRESLITDFQNNLTSQVFEQVSNEGDILKVLEILADSEGSLGKMYKSLSSLMLNKSEYYRNIAAEIDKIANDEINHQKLLLKDRDRLKARKS
jgi:hypothetical protein